MYEYRVIELHNVGNRPLAPHLEALLNEAACDGFRLCQVLDRARRTLQPRLLIMEREVQRSFTATWPDESLDIAGDYYGDD